MSEISPTGILSPPSRDRLEPREVKLLSPEIIHRIAAGEIVDRPASVVKELIENSLDAGARHLRVTLIDGGLKQIRVEDDGWGLSRADLEVCLQRHATSKIRELNDLEAIFTLGFRGEALSAVASVSRLSIETFRVHDGSWKLEVLGGAKQEIRPSSRTRGTLILVEDLFFNIPARRKFLKKPATESRECLDVLESLAIAHPEVSFEWYLVDAKGEVKNQAVLQPEDFVSRFVRLCKAEAEAIHIEQSAESLGVRKFQIVALKAPAASPHQKAIRLSVNGRFIVDKRLPYAARDAYAGLIEVGSYPFVHVSIEVDPSIVDVNIHPQKKEIRWPTGFSLAGMVYNALRPHFEVRRETITMTPTAELFTEPAVWSLSPASALAESNSETHASSSLSEPVYSKIATPSRPTPSSSHFASPSQTRPPFDFRALKVVGEVGAAWIVCEAPQGLVIIDQHAAHERVSFETILKTKNLLRTKPLLVPMQLKLPQGVELNDELVSALSSLGFEVGDREILSDDEIELVAVPDTDRKVDWTSYLDRLFHDLAHGDGARDFATQLKVKLASSLACHGSVRRGQRLGNDEIRQLLSDLSAVEWGGFCPHGRPLWFLMPHQHIEELFHR
jgi:DNA mismatch repair protein MutL